MVAFENYIAYNKQYLQWYMYCYVTNNNNMNHPTW